jgi:molybdenum cofactor sulfurtransferase
METFCNDLKTSIYGNPHSDSTPSRIAGHRIDEIRERTLEFFGADSKEYDLIFVANATAAFKLVSDGFRDYRKRSSKKSKPSLFKRLSKKPNFNVYYHRDAHTSLVGMREYSSHQKCFTSDEEVDSWIDSLSTSSATANENIPTLFSYPGQSNLTGRRLPIEWCKRIRSLPNSNNIYTLLDAAALATTKRLEISAWQPDFVAVSFYKIFGFPDLGALIVRKDTGGHILDARKYFGGGTVDMVIALDSTWHVKKSSALHERHEDGTLPFHNIIALDHALDAVSRIYGSMDAISTHTASLTRTLHSQLTNLKHSNGIPLINIYNDPSATYGDPLTQGATISFSVIGSNGRLFKFTDIERRADVQKIYVRTGSLCNPGGMAKYLNWNERELRIVHTLGHSCTEPIEVFAGRPTGVVRVSFGACSSQADIDMLMAFLKREYIDVDGEKECPCEERVLKERNMWMHVRVAPAVGRGNERWRKTGRMTEKVILVDA